jgi:hypothetical protein
LAKNCKHDPSTPWNTFAAPSLTTPPLEVMEPCTESTKREARRRFHLSHERNIRRLGLFYYVVAFLAFMYGLGTLFFVLLKTGGLPLGSELVDPEDRAMLLEGLLPFAVVGGALALLGYGLRKHRNWAR